MRKTRGKDFKRMLKKTWWFIWEDDSLASWLVNVVLAFVLIKFIVYPGLGFLLSTSHPIVAVVSSSMEHDGSFDEWWGSEAMCGNSYCNQAEYYSSYGISKDDFKGFNFKNGFNRGDIMILYGTKAKDLKKGHVLVFRSSRPDPIIHRIVRVYNENGIFYFHTKGDNNVKSIVSFDLDEVRIAEDQAVGRAVLRIPFLGYIKIWFVELVQLFRW